jgi:hypothetical protein
MLITAADGFVNHRAYLLARNMVWIKVNQGVIL